MQPAEVEPTEQKTEEPGAAASVATAPSASTPALVRTLLPRSAPKVEGFDLAGGTALEPTRPGSTVWTRVGLEGGRVAMVALHAQSDATPPPLTLAVARAFLIETARTRTNPAQVLADTNDAVARTALEGGDPTVACALLVAGPEGVEWACAGQVQGGLIRRDGTFDELTSHGPPLGMLPGFQYGASSLDVGPGDEVIVLTGASAGLFRGAADLVASLTGKPAGEVVSTVHKAIRKAQQEHPVETTVLFLRKH